MAFSLLLPFFSTFSALFLSSQNRNSLVFNSFRTLSQKHLGWVYPAPFSIGDTMNSQSTYPSVESSRCAYRTRTGRRCRLLVSAGPNSALCLRHHAAQQEEEIAEDADLLFNTSQAFQTAQGINNSLRNRYWLVAQNRVSTRRASVLAYIGSLLLRTFPAIDADHAAGIVDVDPANTQPVSTINPSATPTTELAPQSTNVAAPKPAATPASSLGINSETEPERSSLSASTWDSPLPKPDPTKKPS
jgi:hypothetical protein